MTPANSYELLCVFQRIRRAHPDTTDTMNFLIDLLEVGDVGYAIDCALAAATGTAKTAEQAECEASQSGGEAVTPNPFSTPSLNPGGNEE